jgi:hypothetical protein
MFDHELNPVKGWPSPYALDKAVTMDASVTAMNAGMVVALNSSAKGVLGAANFAMPMFVFQNLNDFDTNSDVGNISGGKWMCLVATGGYELESTEYAGTGFVPNAALGSDPAGATPGKLEVVNTGSYAKTIVGIVSDITAPFTNSYRKSVVRFWPVFIPKY